MLDETIERPGVHAVVGLACSMPAESHKQAFLAAVETALLGQSGICLTGEPGCGQLAFIESLAAALPAARVMVLAIDPAATSATDLHDDIFAAKLQRQEHAHVLVIVRDADAIRVDTLKQLELLASDVLAGWKGIQFLLAGHPSLIKRLRDHHCDNLLTYLKTRLTLAALSPEESAGYLARLVAAIPAKVIPAKAAALILQQSAGNPGLIQNGLDSFLATREARGRISTPPPRRYAAIWLAASVALLVAGIGGLLAVSQGGGPSPAANVASAPFETVQKAPPPPVVPVATPGQAATAPGPEPALPVTPTVVAGSAPEAAAVPSAEGPPTPPQVAEPDAASATAQPPGLAETPGPPVPPETESARPTIVGQAANLTHARGAGPGRACCSSHDGAIRSKRSTAGFTPASCRRRFQLSGKQIRAQSGLARACSSRLRRMAGSRPRPAPRCGGCPNCPDALKGGWGRSASSGPPSTPCSPAAAPPILRHRL